ncbi:MAG: DUF4258 domain-containing protein [Armatimonadota bacterium]
MAHPVDPTQLRFSTHALERMYALGIAIADTINALRDGELIEDYPDALRGACALVLGWISGSPVHIVAAYGASGFTLVITAYSPDPTRWSEDFRVRLPKGAEGA